MNKMERNDLRIERITNERKNLLSLVKENIIKDQNEYLRDDISTMVTVLVKDEENVKSYKAVVKAQALIEDLTKQIVEATTHEEIIAIRNKLNYYINKIKKIAESRGLDTNLYYEHASILRKDISKYIRFLKKEKRIEELRETNSNYDNLSDEEKKKLSKNLSNERDYNTRVMKKPIESTYTPRKRQGESEVVEEYQEQEQETTEEGVFIPKRGKHERKTTFTLDPSTFPAVRKRQGKTYVDDEDFLEDKVDNFSGKYYLITPHAYKKSIIGNMFNYLRNIRIYSINKKSIRKMIWDFQNFYGGDDFYTFIEYNRTNNSFREGLRSVFKRSSLYNNENLYLDNHERCIDWMLRFIQERGIKLNYELKEKTV